MTYNKVFRKIIKSDGKIKGGYIILSHILPTLKHCNNELFLMVPDFKTMVKHNILAIRSINKFKEVN